jgi:hypothetical protein
MSTRPIGKIIPEAAPSFLVQLLIPESDGFSAQEVSIPVEGLIPTSGTWIPVVSNVAGAATVTIQAGPSYYTRVGNIVTETFQINVQMDALQTDETFNVSTAILRSADFPDTKGIRGTWSLFETAISYINNISVTSAESTKLIEVSITTNPEAKASIQLNHQYSLV